MHHQQIKPGSSEYVLQRMLAVGPASRAVIFIHGFGGQCVHTWHRFQEMLPNDKDCSKSDVIFYSYNTYQSPEISSGRLETFLGEIFSDPAKVLRPEVFELSRRGGSLQYESVLIVGHSLGSLITRRALVRAYQINCPWAKQVKIALFAPAHSGAAVLAFADGAVKMVGKFVPSIRDLRPGSRFLTDLEKQTNALISTEGATNLVAEFVLLGEHDKTVEPQPFAQDPPSVIVPGKNHRTICKPNTGYYLPVTQVVKSL